MHCPGIKIVDSTMIALNVRVQTKSADGLSCLKQHFDDESQVILNLLNENNRHLSSLMFLLIHYECLLNTDVIKQKGCLHNFYYLYRRMI